MMTPDQWLRLSRLAPSCKITITRQTQYLNVGATNREVWTSVGSDNAPSRRGWEVQIRPAGTRMVYTTEPRLSDALDYVLADVPARQFPTIAPNALDEPPTEDQWAALRILDRTCDFHFWRMQDWWGLTGGRPTDQHGWIVRVWITGRATDPVTAGHQSLAAAVDLAFAEARTRKWLA